jgi:membrane fusion protein
MGAMAVAMIAAFVIFGEYTRRVRVAGTVTPSAGVVRVFAPQAGRVIDMATIEGASVIEGDLLYTLGLDSITALGETEAAVITQLRVQRDELLAEIDRRGRLDAIEKTELLDQERALLREIAEADKQIADTAEYVGLLKALMEKHQQLAAKGITVQREFEIRQQNYMQTRDALGSLRRQRTQLDQRLIEVRAKLASSDGRSASTISELHRRIAEIDMQSTQGEARRGVQVRAPRDGTVTGILVQQGQLVAAGAPLLAIVPADGELEIHFSVPSSAIGFVKVGAVVLLRYAAFPYQRFGQHPGTVTMISRVTMRPDEVDAVPVASGEPAAVGGLGRVTVLSAKPHVTAYGQPEPLQSRHGGRG